MKIPEPYIGMHMDKALLNPQGPAEAVGDKKAKLAGQSSAPADRINISDKARDVQRLTQLVVEVPELRAAKVEAVQARITAGIYGADGRAVAEKILESTLLDKVL